MKEGISHEIARTKAKAIRRFYHHLIVYVIANAALFAIDIVRSPEHLWFYWVSLGWGLCLVLRGLSVFRDRGPFGAEWEEKKVRKIMQREGSAESS